MVLCIQWKLLLGTNVLSLFREYNRGRRNPSDHSYISHFHHSCNTTIDNAFIGSIRTHNNNTLAAADIADIRVSGNLAGIAGIAGIAVISDIKDISDNLADIANISDIAGIADVTNVTDVSNLNLTSSSHNAHPAVADITHLDFNTTKDRPHGDHRWSSSGHTTRSSCSNRPVIVFERAKEKAKRGGCEPRPTAGTGDVNICVFWKRRIDFKRRNDGARASIEKIRRGRHGSQARACCASEV
jgi:hypothetical protein